MENKTDLINELFDAVKCTLNTYGIEAQITNEQDYINIHDNKRIRRHRNYFRCPRYPNKV